MTVGLEPLLKHLSLLVERLPPDVVDRLAQILDGRDVEKLRGRLGTLAATADSKSLYQELDRLWSGLPDIDPRTLSVALRSARWAFAHSTDIHEISIVWTGPATEIVPLRRTEQVLREIIDGAKLDLLIVSFVVYKIEGIMAALGRALTRGVKLKMILEDEEESGGKISFDQIRTIKKSLPGAHVFCWPLENRCTDSSGHYGTIHAKCAVADRDVTLVSSANLTEFAFELNMELGLVVRGPGVGKSIVQHFDELIRRNVLVEAS